jgi:hypothetical protein
MIFGCIGLYGFGVTASRYEFSCCFKSIVLNYVDSRLIDYHWTLPIMFFGFQVGGMVIGAVAGKSYLGHHYFV